MPLPIFNPVLEERPHISFSEVYKFSTCPYNHWLSYRVKTEKEDTIYTVFGTAMGSALENYKKNGRKHAWITLGKTIFRFISNNEWSVMVSEKDRNWRFWVKSALRCFGDTLKFLDETYPGWELIDFEFPLFEDIEGSTKKFKGYIDIIFKYKERIKIIDFKTTTITWDADKRSDTHKLYQIALYKHFWCQKTGTDPNLVDTAFLLLLRKPAKNKSSVELFEQTSGKVKLKNAVEWLSEQARGIEKGIRAKNRTTCQFCQCGESDNTKKWESIRAKNKK